EPVVILNKADLNDDTDDIVARIAEVAPQVPVQVVSAQSRRGLKALARWLVPGRTIALLGSSGVGKSTLINRLVGEPVQDTQEVRVADRKGRHTTTQRELLVAPSGVIVIDTPGLREIQPWDAGSGVDAAFEDVVALTTRCRFRDCTHTVEPGCAVQAALTDGSFAPQRWEAYQRMRMASGAQTPARPDREGGIRRKAEHKKAVKALRQRIHEKIGEE
ncbi:MAG TPA: ribosome small subunit-dependent GTPase A, partial [Candidatus Didemnitutus sp.]